MIEDYILTLAIVDKMSDTREVFERHYDVAGVYNVFIEPGAGTPGRVDYTDGSAVVFRSKQQGVYKLKGIRPKFIRLHGKDDIPHDMVEELLNMQNLRGLYFK